MRRFAKVIIVLLLFGGCVEKGKKELTSAQFLETDARFEEAIKNYNEALAKNPKLLEAHAGLITCYFQLEKGDSIVEEYRKLLEQNPDNSVYLYSYGLALRVKGEIDSALVLYKKAMDKGLKEGRLYSSIAYIYELRGNDAKAKEFYKKAADRGYGSAFFSLAYYEKDKKKRVKLMEKGLNHLMDKGDGYYRLGWFYLEEGNEKEAEKWLKKADKWGRDKGIKLYQNTHLAAPLVYQADKLLDQALFDKAIEKYKEALKKKDDWAYAHYKLGWAYYRKGEYDMAMKEYKRALELYPNYASALNGMAAIYDEKYQYALSETYYERYMRIDPCGFPYSNLAILYKSQGKYDKALETVDRGLKITPNDAHSHYIKGNIFFAKREYDKAIESYKKAEEIRMGEDYLNSELYYKIARAYYYRDIKKGTLPKETKELCLSYLQKAIDAYPDNKSAQSFFARVSKIKTREEK